MFCIARFECVWTSLFCSFLVQFVARKWRKVVNLLFKIITCIVLGCQPASTILGEARGPFVATYVVLKLLLLYRRMVLQLHTVCGVVEGSCLFLFLFGSFAFFTMAFPMRNLTRLVAVRYFLT
jgi:hypothetical protein